MWQSQGSSWPQTICEKAQRIGLVYSRHGYGKSPTLHQGKAHSPINPQYMHEEALITLPCLLAELNCHQPVLIGHSDGASIALIHAAEHACKGLIVLAPHLFVESLTLQSIAKAQSSYLAGPLRDKLSKYHDRVDDAFWPWCSTWLSQAFSSFDIRSEVSKIQAPVCAIQGVDDPYGTAAQIDAITTHHLVNKHLLPHCGHNPHRESADKCDAIVLDFLNRFVFA
jgi:pimeloyl-ACP methyl ester carboxylesterase